jgi:hypothetical protein
MAIPEIDIPYSGPLKQRKYLFILFLFRNLTQMTSYDDFMLNAPVVLDILPGDGSFNYRVLCKVVGVDQEMTGLKVISQSDR